MSKNKGLKFEMRQFIKENYKNNNTARSYKRQVNDFVRYIKENGYTANQVRQEPRKYIQMYTDCLLKSGKTADTIHSYISFVCVFFGVKMSKINKPKRKASEITRGRGSGNRQGKAQEKKSENARLVEFQKRVGIRRAELESLKRNNFVQDENGYWCVEVVKGKGGKYQLQRVTDKDVDFIKEYFDGSNEYVFERREMNNKIDLHAMRAAHAKEMYEHYLDICKSENGRQRLKDELLDRFYKYNKKYRMAENKTAALSKFMHEMDGDYKLRKDTKLMALMDGKPVKFDKTAVMAVSVFHLSHWRCDVTVRNYLLA